MDIIVAIMQCSSFHLFLKKNSYFCFGGEFPKSKNDFLSSPQNGDAGYVFPVCLPKVQVLCGLRRPDIPSSLFRARRIGSVPPLSCRFTRWLAFGSHRWVLNLGARSYVRVPLHGKKRYSLVGVFKLSFLNYFLKRNLLVRFIVSQKCFLEIILFISIFFSC